MEGKTKSVDTSYTCKPTYMSSWYRKVRKVMESIYVEKTNPEENIYDVIIEEDLAHELILKLCFKERIVVKDKILNLKRR